MMEPFDLHLAAAVANLTLLAARVGPCWQY